MVYMMLKILFENSKKPLPKMTWSFHPPESPRNWNRSKIQALRSWFAVVGQSWQKSWDLQKLIAAKHWGMRTSELPGGCSPVFVWRGDLRFLGCSWWFIVWSTLDASGIHEIREIQRPPTRWTTRSDGAVSMVWDVLPDFVAFEKSSNHWLNISMKLFIKEN